MNCLFILISWRLRAIANLNNSPKPNHAFNQLEHHIRFNRPNQNLRLEHHTRFNRPNQNLQCQCNSHSRSFSSFLLIKQMIYQNYAGDKQASSNATYATASIHSHAFFISEDYKGKTWNITQCSISISPCSLQWRVTYRIQYRGPPSPLSFCSINNAHTRWHSQGALAQILFCRASRQQLLQHYQTSMTSLSTEHSNQSNTPSHQ